MINKLKIGLMSLAALALVLSGATSVGATAGDLTWSAAQTIDLSSPDLNLTIASGSTAESMVVNAGTIVPTLASGDVFTVALEAAGDFSVSPTTGVVITCPSTTIATVTITATGSQAYTITPSATACAFQTAGGGGGSTTSTVAQSTTPVTVTVAPGVTETTMSPGCSGGNKFNTSTGALCNNTMVATAKASYNLGTVTLKNGSKGESVKELQRVLNKILNLGLVVDGKLGPKTIAVIKTWQKDHGLKADGLVGAKTKAKMKAEAEM